MDHLIKDSATLELFAWLNPDDELPGWDVLTGSSDGVTPVSYTHLDVYKRQGFGIPCSRK